MKELYTKIGKLLRLERTRRDIALEDMATDLKISEAHLEAIEDGDATRLPSELYFKLFAKSYAEALGIDYEATVEAIEQDISGIEEPADQAEAAEAPAAAADSGEPPAAGKTTSDGSRRQLKKLLYLIGAVIVLFLVVVAVNELFLKGSDETPMVDSLDTEHAQTSTAGNEPSDELANYDWNVPAYHAPDSLRLLLVARSGSWATVLADGDTAVYRTLTPGRRYEVAAQYRLRVSVGIPSVVDIELNGQPVNLRNPESGRIAGVEIDQINVEKYLARPLTWVRPQSPPPAAVSQPAPEQPEPSSAGDTGTATSGADDEVTPAENELQDSL